MNKAKLILLTGLAAAIVVMGSWAPMSNQVDNQETIIASGNVQQSSIPTILPPL
ncbi:hypothetical protein [Metaplanococcus flavidus]|uniref:Uncharacterized protein n=1 Tax=Metaplanococcus flavidus TaxID=569883 RepID=A0ABW3LCF4_9BACL